jgi:hypothetical protein
MPQWLRPPTWSAITRLSSGRSQVACIAARKGRDGAVKDTYDRKIRKAFATYGAPEFAANRVEVFRRDGSHLPQEQVKTRIRKHLVGCYESAQFESWAKINF